MSRDDSLLYSGASSASFSSTARVQRQSIKEEKKEKRGQLKPVAKLIFDELNSEMDSVMFVMNIDIENATDEKLFMIEMMARKKYVQYLKQLKNKLDNILREDKSTLKKAQDEQE